MATASPSSKTAQAGNPPAGKEKFLVIPIIILILAQMGATGDNGALSLSATALTQELHATTSEIQLANMVYPLVGGAFMIAGGLMGTIIGWKRTFRIGILLCAIGEIALAFAPNMTMFIWVGRVLVGFGASFMIPSVLGLIPLLYRGSNRMVAFGCIGAASGLSALLPLVLGVVLEAAGMHVTFLVLAAYFAAVLLASFLLPAIDQTDEKLRFDGIGVALAASRASRRGASSSRCPDARSSCSGSPPRCPWRCSACSCSSRSSRSRSASSGETASRCCPDRS